MAAVTARTLRVSPGGSKWGQAETEGQSRRGQTALDDCVRPASPAALREPPISALPAAVHHASCYVYVDTVLLLEY